MEIQILQNYESLNKSAAKLISELLKTKPNANICLPSGNSPLGLFAELISMHNRQEIDFSNATFFGLDEWVGLGAKDYGGCRYMLAKAFLEPIGFRDSQIVFFDGMAQNFDLECQRINEALEKSGGLDCIVLGLGMNGHLALNEPGTLWNTVAHVSVLAETTTIVGQKYFQKETILEKGFTLGVKNILDAKMAILIVSGGTKAKIILAVLQSEPTFDLPATALHIHKNAVVLMDKEAASLVEIGMKSK